MRAGSAAGAYAAGVSRALRDGGLRPLPSGTPVIADGLRVTRGPVPGTTNVRADFISTATVTRVTEAATKVLTEAGYTVEEGGTPGSLWVTRP